MTMRLTIKNEDLQRSASVVTQVSVPEKPDIENTVKLGPGESTEAWIHANAKVVISEDPYPAAATPIAEGELVNDPNGNPSYATVTTPARPFPGSGDPGDPGPGTPDVEPKRETTE